MLCKDIFSIHTNMYQFNVQFILVFYPPVYFRHAKKGTKNIVTKSLSMSAKSSLGSWKAAVFFISIAAIRLVTELSVPDKSNSFI